MNLYENLYNEDVLLAETLRIMERHGKNIQDIEWIGSYDAEISLDDFIRLASDRYDCGFGSQEVAEDLLVVFNDGSWLERHEYDGSEWWEYKKTPARPKKLISNPDALTCKQAMQIDKDLGYEYKLIDMNKWCRIIPNIN